MEFILHVCSIIVLYFNCVFTQPTIIIGGRHFIEIEGVGTVPQLDSIDDVVYSIRAKKYEKAVDQITDIIRKSADTSLKWLRGYCNLQLGFPEEAIKDLRGSQYGEMNYKAISLYFTEALLSANNYTEAEEFIEKHLQFSNLLTVGNVLCSKRKFNEALHCYSEALIKSPSNQRKESYISRAACYARMGKLDLSLADCRQAENDYPTYTFQSPNTKEFARAQYVVALFDAELFSHAEEEIKPHLSDINIAITVEGIFKKNKNFDEVHHFLSKAIGLFPEDGRAYLRWKRGENHIRMENYGEAIKDFEESVKLKQFVAKYWISWIEALFLNGRRKKTSTVLSNFDNAVLQMTNEEITKLEELRKKILKKNKNLLIEGEDAE